MHISFKQYMHFVSTVYIITEITLTMSGFSA